jgi:hypothetical protein
MSRRLLLVLLTGVLLAAACGSPSAPSSPANTLKMAPASALPAELRRLPQNVQEAYRYALANPDVLDKIPCYCGCNQVGHMDNRMCYIQSETAGGRVVFDAHGAG